MTISIDGPGIYATYGPNGSTQVPFACDGNKHSYTLTAIGKNRQKVAKTKLVKQN